MVFGVEDVVRYNDENIKIYGTAMRVREAVNMDKDRRSKEARLIDHIKPCVLDPEIYQHLDHIKSANLKDVYNDQFYSEGFMRFLGELTCPIYYPISKQGEIVKEWLDNFKKIGEESVEGVAIKASLGNDDGLFVIKGPRNKTSDLAHEAVVGMALNPLRARIPNFSWVFGVLRCGIPITDKDQLLSWCSAKDPVNYVVYERVPGKPLAEFLKTCTAEQFVDVYLQILQALYMASVHCDFTHYDLHHENVIVRPLNKTSTIVYDINGKRYYHKTNNVATLIDYGFSHCIFEGSHYGRADFRGFSIFPNRGYPIFDAFKLLCFCAEEKRPEIQQAIVKIMRFFTNDNINDIVTKLGPRAGYYYCLPLQLGKSYSVESLINYIVKEFRPDNLTTKIGEASNILECNMAGTCLDHDVLVDYLGLDKEDGITSILGYKIALEHNTLNTTDRDKFKHLFTNQLYTQTFRRIRTLVEEFGRLNMIPTRGFPNANIARINLGDAVTRDTYRKYVNSLVSYIAKYNKIVEEYSSLEDIMLSLDFDPQEIATRREAFQSKYQAKVLTLLDMLDKDVKVLQEIPEPYANNARWFFYILPTYVTTLHVRR